MATAEAASWSEQDTRKMLHAVYRVGDIEKTAEYYKKHLGMKQLRYRDMKEVGLLDRLQSSVKCGAAAQVEHCRCDLGFRTNPCGGGTLVEHQPSLLGCLLDHDAWAKPQPHCCYWLQDKYINSFLGFGPEDQDFFSLELTYNYGVTPCDAQSLCSGLLTASCCCTGSQDNIKIAGS